MAKKESKDWLLLMHQLPPQPDSFRVKVWRSLQRIGAISVKNSVYVLPNNELARASLTALVQEIQAGGGEAFLCDAVFLEGVNTASLIKQFNEERDIVYKKVIEDTEPLLFLFKGATSPSADKLMKIDHSLGRLRRQLNEAIAVDHFGAKAKGRAESRLGELERKVEATREGKKTKTLPHLSVKDYQQRVWITRRNLFVDRLASAWLIKRFIDKNATFKFIDPDRYTKKGKEVSFDMFEAEFGHFGDCCTFETLIHVFRLKDLALIPLAEIIHDIDLDDQKYNHEETAGIRRIIKGLAGSEKEDEKRLARASTLFDDLHSTFS